MTSSQNTSVPYSQFLNKINSFLITCNMKGFERIQQSYYPKLWHIGPPQSTYLGPVRDFAHINSLKQHFQIKSINIMTLAAEKITKKGYNKCKLKDLLSHTQKPLPFVIFPTNWWHYLSHRKHFLKERSSTVLISLNTNNAVQQNTKISCATGLQHTQLRFMLW